MEKQYFGSRAEAPIGSFFGELIAPREGDKQKVFAVPENFDAGETTLTIDQSTIHLSIVVGARARATLFINYVPTSDAPICDIEIYLAEESTLTCTFLASASTQNIHIQQKSRLQAGAHFNWQNVTLSTGKIEHKAESFVVGHDATSDIDWVFYAHKKDQYTLTANNFFDAKNGGGEITMQGVAENTAHALCNGLINIGLDGQGTDTYLTESVLMLDPTAKVDAIPGLEIKTNDVKASHSATVSRVTAEDLYYFAARGIPMEEARQMFILGFLAGRLEQISNPEIQESVRQTLAQKYSSQSVLST